MGVLRLVGILTLLAVAGSIALYFFTRDPRFLHYARRIFQFALMFLLVFMALFILERLVLVV